MPKRTIVLGGVLGVGLALLADGLVLLFIRNVWRIAGMLAGDHVGAVLHQLTEAEVALPWLISLVFAAATALSAVILHRNRALCAVLIVFLAVAGLAATFLFTSVNDIPMYTALRALWGLVRSGAF